MSAKRVAGKRRLAKKPPPRVVKLVPGVLTVMVEGVVENGRVV